MQGTAATKRHGRELCRIMPTLDGYKPDRTGHLRVGDTDDGFSRGFGGKPQRLADMREKCRACCLDVQPLQFAADRLLGVDASEHDIGIGQRRALTTLRIGNRGPVGNRHFRARPREIRWRRRWRSNRLLPRSS